MNKQKILNIIIILSVVALSGIIGWIIYDPKTNFKKEAENNNTLIKNEVCAEEKDEVKEQPGEEINTENAEEQYVGEEETSSEKEENVSKSKEEKAIDLAKKEWGDDDSVSFNIEEKKGNVFYVAVKSDASVISWYEVNTETWEISEF